MNIKYLFLLFVVFFLAVAFAGGDQHSSRKISNCKELRALRKEKVIKRRIKLVKDIDCENIPFSPLNILFTKFDGNGHTIKNLNLSYNKKRKNIHQIGLFKSLASGSIIRNVTFVNVNVRGIRNVGVVAGKKKILILVFLIC